MSIPVLSDQDFSGGAKITGLSPATANGEPLTYEQLGGGVVELATITVPGLLLDWMQDVARPGVTTTNTVQCWFAPTTADDNNELDWMGGMTIFAEVVTADAITFCWSSPTPEIGAFKINFMVR